MKASENQTMDVTVYSEQGGIIYGFIFYHIAFRNTFRNL